MAEAANGSFITVTPDAGSEEARVLAGATGQAVLDLREEAAAGAGFVMAGELLFVRVADGAERPLADDALLRLDDDVSVPAEAVREAVTALNGPLALIEAAGLLTSIAAARDVAGEPETDAGSPAPMHGGAGFRDFAIGSIGDGLDPILALDPLENGRGGLDGDPESWLGDLAGAGDAARFYNLAPRAEDDFALTSERAGAIIDVLANDQDGNPDDVLRITSIDASGLEGRVTLNPDGTLSYDPSGRFTHLGEGESATETFSYTVSDPHGGRSTATVVVRVTGVNDAPEASDDAASTSEKEAVEIAVLANDRDPDTNDTLSIVGVDTTGLRGIVTVNPDGTIAYDPNGGFTHLAVGQTASETFTYTIADQHGASSTATVEVTITGVNDAPIPQNDKLHIRADEELRFDPVANDRDPDQGDTIHIAGLGYMGAKGDAWLDAEGLLNYRPSGAFDYLGQGEMTYETVGYYVMDQHGAWAKGYVTIVIEGVNDAPEAEDDLAVTDEKTPIVIDVLANDRDVDATDTLSIASIDTAGLRGTVTINQDGTLSYDPNGQFTHLALGQSATETFSYTVTDQHGATSTAEVTVTITGANDAPIARNDKLHIKADEELRFDPVANDRDPDQGDTIHIAGFNRLKAQGEVWLDAEGLLNYRPSGAFDYLGAGEATYETVSYYVMDQHGAWDTGYITIVIEGVNDAPEAADDRVVTDEKSAIVIDVLANDRDVDATDTLSIASIDTAGLRGTVTINPDGTLSYDPNGQFTHLALGQSATETFSYTATDQHGATSTATVEVTVEGVNDAPIARNDKVYLAADGEIRFDPIANDRDPDQGDTIKIACFNPMDAKGEVWIDAEGLLNYRPSGAFDYLGAGEATYETVSYYVVDQHGARDKGYVTIVIEGVNDAPEAENDVAVTDEKTAMVIDVLVNDHDLDINDILSIASIDTTGLAGTVTVNPDGTLSYDPNGQFNHLALGQSATETFSYTATDQHGATSTAEVTVTIEGVNDAPTAVADHFTGYQGIGFFTTIEALLGNDYDIDGDPIQFLGAGGAVNGDVTVTPEGYVVFTPEAGFLYAIADQHGALSYGEVYVDVVELAPGHLTYDTLSWFSAISEAELHQFEDGTSRLDMYLEVGTVAGAALSIGDMPFFTAMLTGMLQGYISVTVDAEGNAVATGDLVGDLDLLIETSPIFTALGGDVYDALALAMGAPAGGGAAPDLGLGQSLADLIELAVQELDLGNIPTEIGGGAFAEANAMAFGNGTFFLDIAGLVSGSVTLAGANDDEPLVDADILGMFEAAAYIDIRDGLNVVSDGYLDGDVDIDVAIRGIGGGFAIGSVVHEEQAIAA